MEIRIVVPVLLWPKEAGKKRATAKQKSDRKRHRQNRAHLFDRVLSHFPLPPDFYTRNFISL